MTTHDVPVDIIATPTRVLRSERRRPRPRRIEWAALTPEQIAAMPPLAALARARCPQGRRGE